MRYIALANFVTIRMHIHVFYGIVHNQFAYQSLVLVMELLIV